MNVQALLATDTPYQAGERTQCRIEEMKKFVSGIDHALGDALVGNRSYSPREESKDLLMEELRGLVAGKS